MLSGSSLRPDPLAPLRATRSRRAWAFVAPAVMWLGVVMVYPLGYAIYLSMTSGDLGAPPRFVGLGNFLALAHTQLFSLALWNTVWYTVVAVAIKLALGLMLALVLAQRAPGMPWIRGAVLMPWIVPAPLSALAWTWMFNSSYSVVNWVLLALHLIATPVAWLGSPMLARTAVVVVNVWTGLPFFGITLLAGLVMIPHELHEAATVDGIGPLARLWRVTLPLLRPVIATVVLFSVVMTSSDFTTIFVLTHGGPMNATDVLTTLAFKLGLATGDLGTGAAISLYLFPVLGIAVWIQARLIRRAWQW